MFLNSFVISAFVGWFNLSLHDWYSCSAGLNYMVCVVEFCCFIFRTFCTLVWNSQPYSVCHSVFVSCFVAQYFLPSKWVPEAHWSWWWKKAVSVFWHVVPVGIIINCYYYHCMIIMSRTLKVTGNHVVYDRGAWFLLVIMSSLHTLCCLLSVKKQKHDIPYFWFNV